MIFENYDRVVFAGDSVTDAGSFLPVGEGLADMLTAENICKGDFKYPCECSCLY